MSTRRGFLKSLGIGAAAIAAAPVAAEAIDQAVNQSKEDPTQGLPQIHFRNLPKNCKIAIHKDDGSPVEFWIDKPENVHLKGSVDFFLLDKGKMTVSVGGSGFWDHKQSFNIDVDRGTVLTITKEGEKYGISGS